MAVDRPNTINSLDIYFILFQNSQYVSALLKRKCKEIEYVTGELNRPFILHRSFVDDFPELWQKVSPLGGLVLPHILRKTTCVNTNVMRHIQEMTVISGRILAPRQKVYALLFRRTATEQVYFCTRPCE